MCLMPTRLPLLKVDPKFYMFLDIQVYMYNFILQGIILNRIVQDSYISIHVDRGRVFHCVASRCLRLPHIHSSDILSGCRFFLQGAGGRGGGVGSGPGLNIITHTLLKPAPVWTPPPPHPHPPLQTRNPKSWILSRQLGLRPGFLSTGILH